jgi:salicylate hydroxylase
LERVAVRPEVLEVRGWDSGDVLARQPMGARWAAEFGGPHYTLHRADLHRLLAGQVPSEQVHLGRRCTGFTLDGDGVRVGFADGTGLRADVLIGADGVHSAVRRATAGPDRPVFSGTAAVRGILPAELLPGVAMDRMYVWTGPGVRMLACPVEAGAGLSFVAVVPEEEPGGDSWSREGDPAALVRAFAGWEPTVLTLVQAVAEVGHWSLYDREPLTHWSTERTSLLGDAAHPMLPHHGQGASQALEDAVALAHVLSRCEGPEQVPDALRQYEELRLAHTSLVREQSLAGGSQRLARGSAGDTGPGGMSKLMEDVSWVQRYDIGQVLGEWGGAQAEAAGAVLPAR